MEHKGGIAQAGGLDDGSSALQGIHRGFTLLEVLAALAILALASSSVMIVIDRCVASASDSTLRMEAFELVRENLEKILILDAVEESADYGTSDKYPDISWQTVIEGFLGAASAARCGSAPSARRTTSTPRARSKKSSWCTG